MWEVEDISKTNAKAWEVWSMEENITGQTKFGAKGQYWQKYTDEQYESLNRLLGYLEERLDIPHNIFEYPIPGKNGYDHYGLYFAPKLGSALWHDYEIQRQQFKGVYGHHNVSNKYDPGPHLDIRKLNFLNFK